MLDVSLIEKLEKGKMGNGDYYYLNYYYFHILVDRTSDQNTNYKKLDSTFFDELSDHKENICFSGYLDRETLTFTPTEMVYHINEGFLGLHVRKKIVKAFKDRGVDMHMIEPKKKSDKQITKFIIAD